MWYPENIMWHSHNTHVITMKCSCDDHETPMKPQHILSCDTFSNSCNAHQIPLWTPEFCDISMKCFCPLHAIPQSHVTPTRQDPKQPYIIAIQICWVHHLRRQRTQNSLHLLRGMPFLKGQCGFRNRKQNLQWLCVRFIRWRIPITKAILRLMTMK